MFRKLSLLGTLVAAIFFALTGWQLFQTKQAMDRGDIERELQEALGMVDRPATLTDQVVETLGREWAGIADTPDPWGFEAGDLEKLRAEPLIAEAAQEALHPSRKLHKFFLERMAASLETPGSQALLNQEPDFKNQRGITRRMASNLLSSLVVGRADEAVRIYETCHRHARIMARGIQGHPSLIASMIALAQQKTIDAAAEHALALGLWPASALAPLEAAMQEAVARNPGLDPAMDFELTSLGKAMEIVDRRLGPAGWVASLYWGDGQEQLGEVRAAWKAGLPPPVDLIRGRCHIMLAVGMPNWQAAKERHQEVANHRKALIAKVQAARGNPGAEAP